MKSHISRFRVTYLTATVAVFSAVGVEFAVLKDITLSELHAKTWAFWISLLAAVIVNAGNTIIAALHRPPDERPLDTKP